MDRNFLIILKHGEKYIWVYDDAHEKRLNQSIALAAADERLSFTWGDAAEAMRTIVERRNSRRSRR